MSTPAEWAAPHQPGPEPHTEQPPGTGSTSGWAIAAPAGVPAAPAAAGPRASGEPPVVPLRPMGATELLDAAVTLVREAPGRLFGIAAVFAAIVHTASFAVTRLFGAQQTFDLEEAARQSDDSAATAAQMLTGLVAGVAEQIVVIVLTGIAAAVISAAVLGRHRHGAGRSRMPAVVVFAVLYTAATLLIWGVVAAVVGGLLLAGAPGVLAALAGVVLVPPAVVATIYLYVVGSLVPAAIVLEKLGPWQATRRLATLLRGVWWRTFGVLLLVILVTFLIQAAVGGLLVLGGTLVGFLARNDVAANALIALGAMLSSVAAWPFAGAAGVLLYLDARFRREGLDLALQDALQDPQPSDDVWLPVPPDAAAGQDLANVPHSPGPMPYAGMSPYPPQPPAAPPSPW